jgi:hypothetical protein
MEVEWRWSLRGGDGGGWGFDGDVIADFLEGLIGVADHRLLGEGSAGPLVGFHDRGWGGGGVQGESSAEDDGPSELLEGNALARAGVEDLSEDCVEFVREGEDGLEKVGVAEVGGVGLVAGVGSLPRVASTGEVDEDHTERPDVVGSRLVAGRASALVAFRRHVKSWAAAEIGSVALGRGQAKVGELDCLTIVADEDVFRFQVAVEDAVHVAMLDGVE